MEKLKIHILRRLYDHTYIGDKHLAIRDLRQGLPKHERDMNKIKKAVKELINRGYLIPYKVDRVSINPHTLMQIKKMIQN